MAHTEVILREKIQNLGSEADVVKVRRGYARNFLIPQGKAYPATRGNLRQIETLKQRRAEREAQELAEAENLASKLKRIKLQLELKTGEAGKAFGSITVNDLVKAIEERTGEKIDRHYIQLDKPIKNTGNFDVPVKLHPEVTFDLRVRVDAQDAGPESESEQSGETEEAG